MLSTFHGKVPKFTVMLDLMFEDQDAKEAIKTLNNYEIRPGRFLVVTKSVDNRRLWVGFKIITFSIIGRVRQFFAGEWNPQEPVRG